MSSTGIECRERTSVLLRSFDLRPSRHETSLSLWRNSVYQPTLILVDSNCSFSRLYIYVSRLWPPLFIHPSILPVIPVVHSSTTCSFVRSSTCPYVHPSNNPIIHQSFDQLSIRWSSLRSSLSRYNGQFIVHSY